MTNNDAVQRIIEALQQVSNPEPAEQFAEFIRDRLNAPGPALDAVVEGLSHDWNTAVSAKASPEALGNPKINPGLVP